ncbi:unnamed protein product [Spodoptera exigua]|nr:unnamed protein product [Spodoptera exigua]
MDPRTLCYVLSTLTLASCARDYYEDRLKTLVHTLSKQRSKYGLNFNHIDNKIPRNSDQESISEYNYIVQEENIPADNNNEVNIPLQADNILIGVQKQGKTPFEAFSQNNGLLPKKDLRICPKKCKGYECRKVPGKFSTPKDEEKKKKRKERKKKFTDTNQEGNKCKGVFYGPKKFTRTEKQNVHNDIDEVIKLLIRVDSKISEYEKFIDPNDII